MRLDLAGCPGLAARVFPGAELAHQKVERVSTPCLPSPGKHKSSAMELRGSSAAGGSESQLRKMEAELRRREAEVLNLERRLKQSKENVKTTMQENEAREQAMTALVRSLEERLTRKESRDSKGAQDPSNDSASDGQQRCNSSENDEGRDWRSLMQQLREAAKQLSRNSACTDDDVKAILHKVLKDAAANKHKVVELKEDVARHKHVLETLETEKVPYISFAVSR